jgi:hypothetical protein
VRPILSICHAASGLPPSPVLSGHSFCHPRSRVVCCAVSLHVLQVMIMPPAHAPHRSLGTCVCSSVTCGPCYLAVAAKYFFIRPRQIVVGHVAVLEPF